MSDQPESAHDPLQEAWEIQIEAARVGFDWPDIEPVFDKLLEEMEEIREALGEGNQECARSELGDLLFAAVNLARFLGVEPGRALSDTNRRFLDRFGKVKEAIARMGRAMEDCSLEEMDEVWRQIKAEE